MAVSSMTGFSSLSQTLENTSWTWEIRAVNGKGLDMRIRVPNGFDTLEQNCRKVCAADLKRGNVQISLVLNETSRDTEFVLNEEAFEQLLGVTERAKQIAENAGHNFDAPTLDHILNMRGVVEISDKKRGDAEREALVAALITSFEDAMAQLVQSRELEGDKLAEIITLQINHIEALTHQIIADPSRSAEAIREKLREQVKTLLEANAEFDEARLYSEAAVLATKADLQEEIDRLVTHIASARDLIKKGGAIGRKLDFLAQEFNRETNTICSKSNASSVTNLGLELKICVDQFREQIQNVE